MLVALFAVIAETAALIVYTVRRGSGADLPSLGEVDVRSLLFAALAADAGYALAQNQDAGADGLFLLVLFGCVLPTQAGAAARHLGGRLSWSADLIAGAGGLAVGTLNPDTPWPWS
ncbi:hypothetical protein GT045_00895 [Streptomyces sp. SID486]|uniref:hypothetical protein n=1 Tax=unclassified Streptomyces TaxID=2593676 RepID=UPI00136A9C5C|nr:MULTISPECIES: hypothetical protein [unclassified Streptomyces]MYW14865.1 hypothetical protein [Streptomyces sp. SID2955]MYW42949.1 hypothetical protein [Streptomyces sp. SID161]MYX93414.1 hypothetical protein [Streptomyces sp. SID486]